MNKNVKTVFQRENMSSETREDPPAQHVPVRITNRLPVSQSSAVFKRFTEKAHQKSKATRKHTPTSAKQNC